MTVTGGDASGNGCGDQVFGERVCATTDDITSTDHSFPDEDFFPDISSLYIDAMADDTGVNLNPNLNANPIPPPAPQLNSTGLAAATRPPPFDGVNYKRWRTRAVLWLKNLGCYSATLGKPEGDLSPVQEEAFQKVDTMFMGALFNILGDNIVDTYMSFDNGKDAWDALDAKFGVSDAGTELYIMEQFYDYKMTDDRPIVDQAHEIQSLAKELEQFKCNLPDKFVAGGIIAKLPPSWRNFATSLKHKRQEFSVSDLIGSLHVEEKARAKDTRPRGFDGSSSAHVVQKNNFQSHKFKNKNRSDGKGKFDGKNKAAQTTNFKKKTEYKKKGSCHVCGDPNHWAPSCPNRFDKRSHGNSGKSANVVLGDIEMKDAGYGRTGWLRADGKRLTCFCSRCWYGGSEVYFGEDRTAEECAARSLNQ
uniref:Uncharacterized protein n=1 Tax=Avena sativa TaxID=4498 RepID=A0ACD5T9F1_AVESA